MDLPRAAKAAFHRAADTGSITGRRPLRCRGRSGPEALYQLQVANPFGWHPLVLVLWLATPFMCSFALFVVGSSAMYTTPETRTSVARCKRLAFQRLAFPKFCVSGVLSPGAGRWGNVAFRHGTEPVARIRASRMAERRYGKSLRRDKVPSTSVGKLADALKQRMLFRIAIIIIQRKRIPWRVSRWPNAPESRACRSTTARCPAAVTLRPAVPGHSCRGWRDIRAVPGIEHFHKFLGLEWRLFASAAHQASAASGWRTSPAKVACWEAAGRYENFTACDDGEGAQRADEQICADRNRYVLDHRDRHFSTIPRRR